MTGVAYQLTRAGFSAAFGGASLYLAVAAKRLFVGQTDWIRRGIVVDGEVRSVDQVDTVQGAVRRKLYAPLVEFSTQSGEKHEFRSALSFEDRDRYAVGQRVQVRYLPEDSSKVDLASFDRLWWPLAALVVSTIICAVIASLPFILPPPSP